MRADSARGAPFAETLRLTITLESQMNVQPTSDQSSAGLPGVLRLTAGLAIVALAVLSGLVVLDVLPREQLAPIGRRILLLSGIVVIASAGIAVLVGGGRKR
jgi:hypothetical protein